MTNRKVRNPVVLALLAACAVCKGAQLRDPGEPVDLPLDDLDAAVLVDGGAQGAMQATAADGGAEAEGAGAGEPEDELGIDLRDE